MAQSVSFRPCRRQTPSRCIDAHQVCECVLMYGIPSFACVQVAARTISCRLTPAVKAQLLNCDWAGRGMRDFVCSESMFCVLNEISVVDSNEFVLFERNHRFTWLRSFLDLVCGSLCAPTLPLSPSDSEFEQEARERKHSDRVQLSHENKPTFAHRSSQIIRSSAINSAFANRHKFNCKF